MCDQGDSFVGVGLERRRHSSNKSPLRLVSTFFAYYALVRLVKKRFESCLEVVKVVEIREPGPVVFVQPGSFATRQTESFSGDASCFGSFRLVPRDDDARRVGTQGFGQTRTLRPALFAKPPFSGRNVRLNIGRRMFDEKKLSHS